MTDCRSTLAHDQDAPSLAALHHLKSRLRKSEADVHPRDVQKRNSVAIGDDAIAHRLPNTRFNLTAGVGLDLNQASKKKGDYAMYT